MQSNKQYLWPIPATGQALRLDPLASGRDSQNLADLALRIRQAGNKIPLVIITANAFDAQRLLEEIP